jgi:hypothetical protein
VSPAAEGESAAGHSALSCDSQLAGRMEPSAFVLQFRAPRLRAGAPLANCAEDGRTRSVGSTV